MKSLHLLLIASLAIFAAPLGAQTIQKLEQQQAKVRPGQNSPEIPVLGSLARGLIDLNGNLNVDAHNDGYVDFYKTANGTYKYRVTIPTVTADTTTTLATTATAALTAGSTVTVTPKSTTCLTLTPAQNETINLTTTGMASGHRFAIVVTTSGTSSYTLTFNTNFKSRGTLVTGTTSAVVYTVYFVFDGTNANEVGRSRDGSASLALTPGATVALGTAEGVATYTLTPGEDETINAAVVERAGREFVIVITTSGTSSRTLTFGTNFKSTGTLATGTSDSKVFVITFISNGTTWNEVSRTAAM